MPVSIVSASAAADLCLTLAGELITPGDKEKHVGPNDMPGAQGTGI
jgi:hypothetical protein